MTPEERRMLERSLKLAEENHTLLRRVDRRAKWAVVWGFVKLAVILVPLILALGYLEPYLKNVGENYKNVQDLIGHIDIAF